ncbi:MAG TPA: hypothetical protein VGG66_09670 [Rhizomicrobium sp.]
MYKSLPFVLAAVLLATLSPVYGADPPNNETGQIAVPKDDGTAATPGAPSNGDEDRTAKVIILGPEGLQGIPNPYDNPAPRMFSDAWAMRT